MDVQNPFAVKELVDSHVTFKVYKSLSQTNIERSFVASFIGFHLIQTENNNRYKFKNKLDWNRRLRTHVIVPKSAYSFPNSSLHFIDIIFIG